MKYQGTQTRTRSTISSNATGSASTRGGDTTSSSTNKNNKNGSHAGLSVSHKLKSSLEIASGNCDDTFLSKTEKSYKNKQGYCGKIVDSSAMRGLSPHRPTRLLLTWVLGIFLFFPIVLFWAVLAETVMRHHNHNSNHMIRQRISKADKRAGGYDTFPINLPRNVELEGNPEDINGQDFLPHTPIQGEISIVPEGDEGTVEESNTVVEKPVLQDSQVENTEAKVPIEKVVNSNPLQSITDDAQELHGI